MERARMLAEVLYGPFNSYHQHKELMGHAAVLVQGSLFVVLMLEDGWTVVKDHGLLSSVIVTLLFLIIHVYMRWQLRYRRLAADQLGGLRRVLARDTVDSTPTPASEAEREPDVPESRRRLWQLCDHLWPFQKGRLPWNYYSRRAEYPPILRRALLEMDNQYSRPIGEWLPTLASATMFAAILVRMSIIQIVVSVVTILVGLIVLYWLLREDDHSVCRTRTLPV